ncbi:MAG: hypothetical protein JXQ29_08670 [Planctomycetes bacterium]|nr:hypothetical protein [Planctomycetota bacterium]
MNATSICRRGTRGIGSALGVLCAVALATACGRRQAAAQEPTPVDLPSKAVDADLAALVTSNPAIRSLDLAACTQLRDCTPLAQLANLREVRLPAQADDAAIRALAAGAGKLEMLRGQAWIRDPEPLARLVGLRVLEARVEDGLVLAAIGKLTRLEELDLCSNRRFEQPDAELAPLSGLQALRVLKIDAVIEGEDLECLRPLRGLQELTLGSAPQLHDLSVLVGMPALQSLDLGYCPEVRDLTPLEELLQLRVLEVNAYSLDARRGLDFLEPVARLPALESLHLTSTCIRDLAPLGRLARLKHLALHEAQRLDDLRPLASLAQLETIELWNCVAVSDLSPLHGLKNLRLIVLLCDERTRVTDTEIEALRKAHPLPCVVIGPRAP